MPLEAVPSVYTPVILYFMCITCDIQVFVLSHRCNICLLEPIYHHRHLEAGETDPIHE